MGRRFKHRQYLIRKFELATYREESFGVVTHNI